LGRSFVWDRLRWREPVAALGDPQITLGAIADATDRIRLGPMVAPLARAARPTASGHGPGPVTREPRLPRRTSRKGIL
jgi:hypothetical protein